VTSDQVALPGRRSEAARNDLVILDAARRVFTEDADAPVSAVAAAAGVGVGALYRRYAGKQELVRRLCADGLGQFVAIAETALAGDPDPWEAFAGFVTAIIDSDVHSLTVHLAGTFTPTAELRELAGHATGLAREVFDRAQSAGAVRTDLSADDLAMVFEQVTAVRVADPERTVQLRRRYTSLLLDAMRPGAAVADLPGPAPTADELGERWRRA
jgi:AcrR family transcriptional regulator